VSEADIPQGAKSNAVPARAISGQDKLRGAAARHERADADSYTIRYDIPFARCSSTANEAEDAARLCVMDYEITVVHGRVTPGM